MDLSKLKKRPSYPFENIAVAIAFSPSLEIILLEAKQIADLLEADLFLFHVGTKTPSKEEMLDLLLDKLGINRNNTRIIWMEGDPVDTILKLSKLNIIDLLIIGALKKENILKFYLGSVARSISRKAKCSVLLLTRPTPDLSRIRKIIVNGVENPKTIHTLNTALYLAKNLHLKEISVVHESHLPGLSMTIAESSTAPEANKIKKEINEEEENQLHSLVHKVRVPGIRINEKVIRGKPGFAIRNFAASRNADILVINSPDTQLNILDRIFTHDIEYILEDLPCNVLLVHSRV